LKCVQLTDVQNSWLQFQVLPNDLTAIIQWSSPIPI